MAIVVDTNVLIFSVQDGHPWQEDSIHAIERRLLADETIYVLPQNLAEFWNVCTRPANKNGIGLSVESADRRLTNLESLLTVLHDTPLVYSQWRKLIVQHGVKGVPVHDARIAAAMLTHGVEQILTYNPRDFSRYGAITPIHPSAPVDG